MVGPGAIAALLLAVNATGPSATLELLDPPPAFPLVRAGATDGGPRQRVRVRVVCPSTRWSLRLEAKDLLRSRAAPERTLPLNRLRAGLDFVGAQVPLGPAGLTLLTDAEPTGPDGRVLGIEYSVRGEWGDQALPAGDSYQVDLSYSVEASASRSPFATPVAFSPDGDGILDGTSFWVPGSGTDLVATVEGPKGLLRRLAVAATEGDRTRFDWDGRDEAGRTVVAGPYRLVAAHASDGGLVGDAWVRVESAPGVAGTGAVAGRVLDAQLQPVAGVQVELRRSSGVLQAAVTADAAGNFDFEGVGAGTYYLRAFKPLFWPQETTLFELGEGERAVRQLILEHNHTVALTLRTSVAIPSPGDLVGVELALLGIGTTDASGVTASIALPPGLSAAEGTMRIDGVPAGPTDLGAIPLGAIARGQLRHVTLLTTVGSISGRVILTATASGTAAGTPFQAEPASTALRVASGELSGRGGLYGRACLDADGDGACASSEPDASSVMVVLEDGSYALADRRGQYHFGQLRPGRHLLTAGLASTDGAQPAGAPPSFPRRQLTRRLIFLPAGQYVRADLALPVPPDWTPPVAEEPFEPDEGALAESALETVRYRPERVDSGEDEGAIDENGGLVGYAPTFRVVAEETPAPAHEATPPKAPSTFLAGLGEARMALQSDWSPLLRGRLALTFQHDFDPDRRVSVVVDTARDWEEELIASSSIRDGYADANDESLVSINHEDRLYARLDLPGFSATAGRLPLLFRGSELLYFQKSYLGAEAVLGSAGRSLRVFGGNTRELELDQVLDADGSTGPYRLNVAPIVPGSVQVDLETLGPDDTARTRVRLAPQVDYLLDEERGLITLTRPLAARTIAGDRNVLRVRYEAFSQAPIRQGWLAGVQGVLGAGDRRLSLSALYQTATGTPPVMMLAEGRFRAGPLLLDAEAGVPAGQAATAPLLESSAGRARATLALGEAVELFAFGAHNGSDWGGRIRSDPVSAAVRSPFGLLDLPGTNVASFPVLGLTLTNQDEAFPLMLPDAAGAQAVGAGLRASVGPVKAVSLLQRSWSDWRTPKDSAELGARARVGSDTQIYAAHRTTSAGGEVLATPTSERTRESVLGAQGTVSGMVWEADYRHTLREGTTPGAENANDDFLVKARYARFAAFQPGALMSVGRRAGVVGYVVQYAAGADFNPLPAVRGYAYGYTIRPITGDSTLGAYAGLELNPSSEQRLSIRFDHTRTDGQARTNLSWDGKLIVANALGLGAEGRWSFTDPDGLLRLVATYRPAGPFSVLARVEQEVRRDLVTREVSTTRTAGADATLQLWRAAALDAKGLYRWQRVDGGSSTASLAGAALRIELGRGFDVRAGGRFLMDPSGWTPGATAEVGFTLAGMLRVGVGANLARQPSVFTIEDQVPGLFVNVTGVHGGAFGAPVSTARELDRPPSHVILATAPSATTPPGGGPEPVTAPTGGTPTGPAGSPPVLAGTVRTVSGLIYRDADKNGKANPEDPVVDGLALKVGEADVSTSASGEFKVENVPADRAVEIKAGPKAEIPIGYRLRPLEVAPSAENARVELILDLVRPWDPQATQFVLELPDGPTTAQVVRRTSFPMAAWIAGLPLSKDEQEALQTFGEEVLVSKNLRLIVVSHAQTSGQLKGNFKRALRGARQLRRYLNAAQQVPRSRILSAIVEPRPQSDAPAGKIELLLVRVLPPPS